MLSGNYAVPPKKRIKKTAVPQAATTGKLSNNLRNNKDKSDSNISKNGSGVQWYTNADTLTKDNIQELKDDINASSPPDIIAVTEIKPKNYTKELQIVEYKIDGFEFKSVNLKYRGSTRGIGIYFRKSLKCSKVYTFNITGENTSVPREVIICFNLEKNKKTDSQQYIP